MGRHKRNKPGQGAYQYKERKLYFDTCECGRRFQTFHKRNLRIKKCGICRRAEAKISPGQEQLFTDPSEATTLPSETKKEMEGRDDQVRIVSQLIAKDKGEKLVISIPRMPGKRTLGRMMEKHDKSILEASTIPTKGGEKQA